ARLLAIAPLARGPAHDAELEKMLADGLAEVGDASPEDMLAALRGAPAPQAQAAIELVAENLADADTDVARYPLASLLRDDVRQAGPQAPQLEGWMAVLEHRAVTAETTSLADAPAAQAAAAASAAPASAAANASA